MGVKNLHIYSEKLNGALSSSSVTLPIEATELLLEKLGEGGHTYLTISDGVSIEIVRAYEDGGALLIDRGKDGTSASAFPKGACVMFKVTDSYITDFVCALPKDCKPNPLPDSGCCGGC